MSYVTIHGHRSVCEICGINFDNSIPAATCIGHQVSNIPDLYHAICRSCLLNARQEPAGFLKCPITDCEFSGMAIDGETITMIFHRMFGHQRPQHHVGPSSSAVL